MSKRSKITDGYCNDKFIGRQKCHITNEGHKYRKEYLIAFTTNYDSQKDLLALLYCERINKEGLYK